MFTTRVARGESAGHPHLSEDRSQGVIAYMHVFVRPSPSPQAWTEAYKYSLDE